uniref:Uncharacterized protein n=1 Tax=Rhizophora mucronata TaxID=61149 RepID=A0A2P2PUV1_RHIMU
MLRWLSRRVGPENAMGLLEHIIRLV